MKKLILLAVVAILAMPASAQKTEPYNSFIQVNGRAEKEVTPDEFYLSIVLDESDSKGKVTIALQRHDMIKALKNIGVDVDKQLKVVDFSSAYFKKQSSLTTAKFQLELHSSEMVAKTYAALDKLGISNIGIDRVSYSKIKELKNEVRIEAIRNAKATATVLAEAVGQKVGRCFYIYDANSDVTPRYYDNALTVRAASSKSETSVSGAADEPLDFKTIKLSYDVNAKFVLE
ncbi:MAG: SIMPL domain-containing protein [Alistipes sp.]